MAAKKKSFARAKTVSVYLDAGDVQGKKPVLLFTASQIDEVLPEAKVQPVPFASEALLGLGAWREQVLPILDPIHFLGLYSEEKEKEGRYLVVRTVGIAPPDNEQGKSSVKIIERCILKVSDQIMSGDIPTTYEVAGSHMLDRGASFVRGLFWGEKDLFILPDLVAMIHSNSINDMK